MNISDKNKKILLNIADTIINFVDGVATILVSYTLGAAFLTLFFPNFANNVDSLIICQEIGKTPSQVMAAGIPFVLFWSLGNGAWNVVKKGGK